MADMASDLRSIISPEQLVRTVEGLIAKRLPVDHLALTGRVIQLGGANKSLSHKQIATLIACFEQAGKESVGEVARNYRQNFEHLMGAFVLCGGAGEAAAQAAQLKVAEQLGLK